MFQERYALFDSMWVCKTLQTHVNVKLESQSYAYIKHATRSHGWKYHRIETIDQDGFPDVIVFKGSQYWLIESKVLKKKALISLSDDLQWQPGQLALMKRSHTLKMNYLLFVHKGLELAVIKGEHHGQCTDYPDFIG